MLHKIIKSCLVAALVCVMSAPVYAEDFFNMYGSARIAVDQNTLSKERAGNEDGDSDLTLGLQGNSRFGARAKKGEISGGFEYGSTANLRLLYASVPMAGGALTIGQTYGPVNIFISDQVAGGDSNMLNMGGLYGGRNPQIKFSTGGLAVALVKTNAGGVAGLSGDVDTMLPKIEAGYSTKMGGVNLGVQFGMQSYTVQRAASAASAAEPYALDPTTGAITGSSASAAVEAKDFTVSSSVVGLMASMGFGMAKVSFDYVMATNAGDYGLWMEGASSAVLAGDEIKDTTTSGMLLVVSAKTSDSMTVEGGYGTIAHQSGVTDAKVDGASGMYVQVTIKTETGMAITPHFDSWDYGKDSGDNTEGTMSTVGVKLMLNF